jgi:D-alanyl-D-alanine carboxypeptidase (penicillin-binding protein 5/6)
MMSLTMILHTYAATDKRAEIVVDVATGRILHHYKSDHIRHPASLTKLMTLYLMFEAIDTGRFTPESKVIFSRFANNKPPSKLGIRVGGSITMREAAYTLIIRSANDVAAAVAETIGGSESP